MCFSVKLEWKTKIIGDYMRLPKTSSLRYSLSFCLFNDLLASKNQAFDFEFVNIPKTRKVKYEKVGYKKKIAKLTFFDFSYIVISRRVT